jgi:hypothetical protein
LGLALATKPLPALLLLPSLFLAHYFRVSDSLIPKAVPIHVHKKRKKQKTKKEIKLPTVYTKLSESIINIRIWQLVAVAIFAAVVANPYSLINASGFFTEQIQAVQTEGQRAFLPGWDITRFFGPLGVSLVLLSILSMIYYLIKAILDKNKIHLILISFPIIFWLAFARGAARNYFYVPMIPVLIIFSAVAVVDLTRWIESRSSNLIGKLVMTISIILVLAQPTITLFNFSKKMNKSSDYTQVHTVFLCQKWIEQTIPQRSKILLYGYYTSLPRLVDFDPNQQAQYGEYFMYSRWKNEYLKELFVSAHRTYLDEKKPLYDLENIRARIKGKEHLLYQYCLENKINYLITYHNLLGHKQLADRLIRTFSSEEYGFGRNIYVFRIGEGL